MNRRKYLPAVIISIVLFLLSTGFDLSKVARKDKTPPAVSLAMPKPTGKNGWYNKPVFITVQAHDSGGVKNKMISLGGGTWYKQALKVTHDGTFMVIGRATDRAGNTGSVHQIIHVDMTAPTVEFTIPVSDARLDWHKDPVTILLAGEDNLSGVFETTLYAEGAYEQAERNLLDRQESYLTGDEQQINQYVVLGESQSESNAEIVLTESGTYRVSGYVEDIAGNQTPVEAEIAIDNIPPQVSVKPPSKYFGEIELNGYISDPESGVYRVWVDKGNGWQKVNYDEISWSTLWQTDDLQDGDYTIKARVIDNAGNTTITSFPVTVINNLWPVFALCGILLSLGLLALYDPRRRAIGELTKSLAKYSHMEYNGRHLRKDYE